MLAAVMHGVFSVRQAPGLQQPSSSGMMPQKPASAQPLQGHPQQQALGPQGHFQQPHGPSGPMRHQGQRQQPSGAQGHSHQPPGTQQHPAGGDRAGPKLGAAAKAAQQSAAQKHQDLVAKARHRDEEMLIGGETRPFKHLLSTLPLNATICLPCQRFSHLSKA